MAYVNCFPIASGNIELHWLYWYEINAKTLNGISSRSFGVTWLARSSTPEWKRYKTMCCRCHQTWLAKWWWKVAWQCKVQCGCSVNVNKRRWVSQFILNLAVGLEKTIIHSYGGHKDALTVGYCKNEEVLPYVVSVIHLYWLPRLQKTEQREPSNKYPNTLSELYLLPFIDL